MTSTKQHPGSISGKRRGAGMALLVFLLALPIFTTQSAQAQTYTVLHTFITGTDGKNPQAGMIHDAVGNLYGTTFDGGDLTCNAPTGCGTIFQLDTTGVLTVLHNFSYSDGVYPYAGVIRDAAGNLYGTTIYGGDLTCHAPYGCGTVFELDPTGMLTVLHSFNYADGAYPEAGLMQDAKGILYGTTSQGGDSTCHDPYPLGCGTVFQLDPVTGRFKVLHWFNRADGAYPSAGLIRDAAGNLYGTTAGGGDLACQPSGYYGCGTVFQLDKTGTLTVLHSFEIAEGVGPLAGVIHDAAGNLYGTTSSGGIKLYYGTVFKLDKTGTLTVLHSFKSADGAYPYAGLSLGSKGMLYGTTKEGGAYNYGTVFGLDPATGGFKVLHSFTIEDGIYPEAGLGRDGSGNLVGTTTLGSVWGWGTLFQISPR